jgi:hypothetical protein
MHDSPAAAKSDLVALVETPTWGDVKFFGRWFLAVAEAQQALEAAFESDPSLRERFEITVKTNLGIDAMLYIHYIVGSYCSFVIDIASENADGFYILAQLGLFVRTGNRYQLSIPQNISPKDAAAAIERLLSTEDDEFVLHHEKIIECMTRSDAAEWQRQLRATWLAQP